MYSLDTITHAIRAVRMGALLPESIDDTSSKQFNTTWKVFLEDLRRGQVGIETKWAAAGRATNETGTGAFPHNRIDQATRFVAGCYILCGYELATPQRKQMPDGFDAPTIADTIFAHAVEMIDTSINMSRFFENQPINIRASHTLHNSIGELYSLIIVALHEIRGNVGQSDHDAIDKALDHCDRHLSRHGIVLTIPSGIAQRMKQAKFQAGVDAVRGLIPDGTHHHQQRPQWQRLQSRASTPEPIAGDSTVVSFDAVQWRQMLKDRAGKPKTDKPDFS